MTELMQISLEYADGTRIIIDKFMLEKLEKLQESISWLERAKNVYQNLQPVFDKGVNRR
jgi:hypothetical protein